MLVRLPPVLFSLSSLSVSSVKLRTLENFTLYLRNSWSLNLRAIENCICGLRSIGRKMRSILRIVYCRPCRFQIAPARRKTAWSGEKHFVAGTEATCTPFFLVLLSGIECSIDDQAFYLSYGVACPSAVSLTNDTQEDREWESICWWKGRGQIERQRESLVLYTLFNTLWLLYNFYLCLSLSQWCNGRISAS
jgi:hypothetical protein